MSENRVIPESLDVRALHELCTGVIAARNVVIRAQPRIEPFGVDLFLRVQTGKGMMDLHIILPPKQAGQLIDMAQEALMMIGGRDA